MRVALGTFAYSAIETQLGGDVESGARAALVHYLRRIKSGRPPVGLPAFSRDWAPPSSAPALELELEQEDVSALEREAVRQDATLDQLVTHAVFVYLADLDRPEAAGTGRKDRPD
ncbi:MAG TPA: hypothetical protein VGF04_01460 [Solirubrobacterales bacterium]|jgi:hypothetical protein